MHAESQVDGSGGRARALRVRVAHLAFWLWVVGSFVVVGSLMLGHSSALPRPATSHPGLQRAIADERRPDERGRYLALHFVYGPCRCSARVLSSLFARRARPDVSERVMLVGAHAEHAAAARAAGFAVSVLEPAALRTRYQLEAAPVLVVADPAGEVRYVGGYGDRKQSLDVRDVAIVDAIVRGDAAPELPLLGCGVSQKLRALLDPLGIVAPVEGEE